MKMLQIEGARNVGKTFLIDRLNVGIDTYKFPFAKFFNDAYTDGVDLADKHIYNKKRELYYLTLGYDITILDLFKKGLIGQDLIVDRGILSNIIYGIQAERITFDDGLLYWKWLCKEYGEFFDILYIKADTKSDNRNKDMWNLYEQKETLKLYQDFFDVISDPVLVFDNKYDSGSVERFNRVVASIFETHEDIT